MTDKIAEFLFHCKYEKNLSNKTLKAYEIDLNQFNLYVKKTIDKYTFDKIEKELVKGFLKEIAGYKPRTILRKIASIKAMFNFFEFENDNFINPFRKIKIKIRTAQDLPKVMNLTEVKKILKTAYSRQEKLFNENSGVYRSIIRDTAVLELLFGTGIRVSELCNIQPDDLEFTSKSILIKGKGKKERYVYLCNPEIVASLKNYMNQFRDSIEEGGYLFINRLGKRLSEQSVRFMIKNYCKLSGITKNVTPHTFRHTFATLLLERDVDIKYIQNLLGHSSIITTQIYTHVSKAKQRRLLTSKHPRQLFSFIEG